MKKSLVAIVAILALSACNGDDSAIAEHSEPTPAPTPTSTYDPFESTPHTPQPGAGYSGDSDKDDYLDCLDNTDNDELCSDRHDTSELDSDYDY